MSLTAEPAPHAHFDGTPFAALAQRVRHAFEWLPRGRTLPSEVWRARHQMRCEIGQGSGLGAPEPAARVAEYLARQHYVQAA